MKEEFISFIWKHQLYNFNNLHSVDGDSIEIKKPGILNTDAGPDFSEAEIRIDHVNWIGDVELHIKSSDWDRHNHSIDRNYEKVILHVVWVFDKHIYHIDGTKIPTIEIANLVSSELQSSYRYLSKSVSKVPCSYSINSVPELVIHDMLDRALAERIREKAGRIRKVLKKLNGDWEELCFKVLLGSFGFRLNKHAMEILANAVSFKLVRKYRSDATKILAIMFGMAGWLCRSFEEAYHSQLRHEFEYLQRLHGLKPAQEMFHWKFSASRPSNFPTFRIAQFSYLIVKPTSLFNLFIYGTHKQLKEWLHFELDEFWHRHYHFNKSVIKTNAFGKESMKSIVINTIVPIRFLYGNIYEDQAILQSSIELLESLKPEDNSLTRMWHSLGVQSTDAAKSQGLIHLYNYYCKNKKCTSCKIGNAILRS